MNDFTKEELDYIYEHIEADVKYYDDNNVGNKVIEKIQSMLQDIEKEYKVCRLCAREVRGL